MEARYFSRNFSIFCVYSANRQKKRELEFDWSDKVEAFEIDKRNHMLRNEDTNKQFYPGAATLAEK